MEGYTLFGINHWSAPVELRERFALTGEAYDALLQKAGAVGISDLIAVSTCNRTEILTRSADADEAMELFVRHSSATHKDLQDYGFVKHGEQALRQFYRVAVGLDAQILGDLQIIKQVKQAYEQGSRAGLVSGPVHRLMQSVFRAHKRSRNETRLASGAATVAYAAVQYARKKLGDLRQARIVLVGAGKIGKITCKNLMSLGAADVTLVNRSRDRAESLGGRFDFPVDDMTNLEQQVYGADLVIVATGASQPVITHQNCRRLEEASSRTVMMDLSVPRNIEPSLGDLDQVDLVNMDMLSDATDEAYRKRRESIPHVEQIIDQEMEGYREWLQEQEVVPTIKALTEKMDTIRRSEVERYRNRIADEELPQVEHLTRRIVNKIMAHSIDHLKENHQQDQQVKQVVESMFKLDTERPIE